MANKKISELAVRTPSLTDLMLVGDPSTGYSYKATLSALSSLLEANIALDDLNDVTITSPTAGQVLSYNGTAWVNDTNGITGTGTTNYVPKFTSSSAIGNSQIFESNTSPTVGFIGIATTTPQFPLQVNGSGAFLGTGSTTALRIGADVNNNFGLIRDGNDFYIQENLSNVQNIRFTIKSGGNTGIGITSPAYKLDVNGDLRVSTIANATTDTDRFIVSDGGVIKYRTGAEVLSDIGGAAASSISGTPNYIAKFTGSSAIGNTVLYEDGFSLGLGTTVPSPIATGFRSVTINGTNRAYVTLQVTGVDLGYFYAVPSTRVELSSQTALPLVFSTNATERMRLDASGNLGLGTSSPTYKLNVLASAGTQAIFQAGQTGVSNGYTINSNGTNLTYQWYNGGNEAMRLDASGNLGLGTTTFPTFSNTTQLVVRGGTGPSIIQSVSNDKGSSITLYSGNNSSDNPVVIYQKDLRFASVTDDGLTGYAERMRITSSGNVGIGTSSPAYKLDVNGQIRALLTTSTAGYQSGIILTDASTTTLGFGLQNTGGSNLPFIYGNTGIGFGTNLSTRMTLDASGNLGLGVTPSAWGSAYRVGFQVGSSSIAGVAGAGASDYFSIGGNYYLNSSAQYIYNTSTYANRLEASVGEFRFFTAPSGTAGNAISFTQAMTLDASGNLLVGTTTVQNSAAGRGNITIGGTSNSILNFSINGANSGYIFHNGSLEIMNSTSNPITFGTVLNERMRITSGGELLINTTSDAGDFKLQVDGEAIFGQGSNQRLKTYSDAGSSGIYDGTTLSQNNAFYWNAGRAFFVTNGAERMRITNSGELLINTTSDAGDYKLQVNGNAYINDFLWFSANTKGIIFGTNSATNPYIQGASDNALYFGTGGNWRLQITSTGNIETTGSIKTAAPSGGTAKPFKIGAAATVTPTSQNRTIEIEIDGTTYYLTAKTTND